MTYTFDCFFFTQCHLFLLYLSSSSSLWTVLDSLSSNIDEILLISPSANVFAFREFNANHKDWLTYFGRTDRPGVFSDSNDLT